MNNTETSTLPILYLYLYLSCKEMQKSNSTAVPELQQSPYEVLGVAKFATPDEIKTAYRKMAMVVPLHLLLIANCWVGTEMAPRPAQWKRCMPD